MVFLQATQRSWCLFSLWELQWHSLMLGKFKPRMRDQIDVFGHISVWCFLSSWVCEKIHTLAQGFSFEFFIMPLFPYLTNREETRNSDFFEKFNKFYFYSPNFPVQSTEPTKMFKFSEEISVYAYFCVYVCVHPLLSQIPLKPWFIICLCFKQREWKFISSFF